MKKKHLFRILSLSLLLKTALLSGQVPYFQSYYPLDKNTPLEVNAQFQDRQGFIWFGTNEGLFRFDGFHYSRFLSTDSLIGNHVTALAQDSVGRIWLGYESGELAFLEKGEVHPFRTREGSAVEPVSDILFDRKGNLWFSTLSDGLYYYVKDRLYRVDQEEGLPDLFIYDLFEDPNGNVWAGTDGGIAVCSLAGREIQIRVIAGDEGLPDVIIKKIRTLHGDTLAFATEDAGMVTYNLKTKEVAPLLRRPWPYGSITDFVIKEDQVWISAPESGLVVYNRRSERLKVFSQYEGQSLRAINALMKDSEGNIWCASKTGVSRTLGDAVEIIGSLQPSNDVNVLAVVVDRQDRVWFSTGDGLFMRAAQADGSITVRRALQNSPFRNANIISLYEDGRGIIWAGLYGNGLLRIDPQTHQVRHFKKELRNGNVLSITGKGNTVWIGTLGGSTSLTFHNGNYVIKNYSSREGLSSDFIYHVFIDSQDRTWFCTDGKGVAMLDDAGFHNFSDGLPSGVVYTVTEDVNRDIWVTCQNNGIYRLEGNAFVSDTTVNLRDNAVQAFVADRQGNLIVAHRYGLDVYNLKGKRMRYWGEQAGIYQMHPNLNAVAKDKYGRLYLGTNKGIIEFSPGNDQAISVPQPVIGQVLLFDQVVDPSRTGPFQYDENSLTFHYTGLWYQNSQNLHYQYKLENYDRDWISSRNREATYSRLPPGEYVFRMRVSDTDNFHNTPETTFAFSISPPFWRTTPFYFFIVAFFVITFYAILKFRERQLLEDKLYLEAKVEERTKEIQQKTEEIQAQNEEIMAQAEEIQGINENLEMLVKQRTAELEKKNKALEEYAFINAHKLRGPVASILGLLNLLSKSHLKEDSPVIVDHLQQSAEKLDAVVRSITEAIEQADNNKNS